MSEILATRHRCVSRTENFHFIDFTKRKAAWGLFSYGDYKRT